MKKCILCEIRSVSLYSKLVWFTYYFKTIVKNQYAMAFVLRLAF
jgi:hypothetical protein